MSEPTSIRASIQIPGQSGGGKLQRLLTFETVAKWIRLQGFDDYTTEGLIEMASRYPTQALPHFRRNFNLMIERVRQKRRRELNLEQAKEREFENAKKEVSKESRKEGPSKENGPQGSSQDE